MRRTFSLVLLSWLAGCGGENGFGSLEQASTQECEPTTIEGVDVYQGDSPIDWAMVKSSGRVFAFSKASQGNYNTQSNFATNWSTLKAQGILRGAYHYFDATIDGVSQAQWFLDQLSQAGGMEPGDLPPALDLECPTSPTQSSSGNLCLGNGKNGWAPTATIKQEVWDWLYTVEAALHVKPVIYTYVSWPGDFTFTDPALAEYPLWIASIPKAATPTCFQVPAPWTKATFWQYSSSMHVPGIGSSNTPADEDRFIGTIDQLNAFVAADVIQDGMMPADAGEPDLATAPKDLATASNPDLGEAFDLGGPDLRHGGGHSEHGCGCQVGARSPVSSGWLLIAGVIFLVRRRRGV